MFEYKMEKSHKLVSVMAGMALIISVVALVLALTRDNSCSKDNYSFLDESDCKCMKVSEDQYGCAEKSDGIVYACHPEECDPKCDDCRCKNMGKTCTKGCGPEMDGNDCSTVDNCMTETQNEQEDYHQPKKSVELYDTVHSRENSCGN